MRSLTTSVGIAARLAHAYLREHGYEAGDEDVRELMLCRAGHPETVRRVRMLETACRAHEALDLTDPPTH